PLGSENAVNARTPTALLKRVNTPRPARVLIPDRSKPMKKLRQDIQYALQTLWAGPAFSAVAVLTIALGIGANTAIFSAVHGVLLGSPPLVATDQPNKPVNAPLASAPLANWPDDFDEARIQQRSQDESKNINQPDLVSHPGPGRFRSAGRARANISAGASIGQERPY